MAAPTLEETATLEGVDSAAPDVTHGMTIAENDFLIALIAVAGSETPATPSGWSNRGSSGTTTMALHFRSKIAGDSEPSSYDFSTTTGETCSLIFCRLEGSTEDDASDVGDTGAGATGVAAATEITLDNNYPGLETAYENLVMIAACSRATATACGFSSSAISAGHTSQVEINSVGKIADMNLWTDNSVVTSAPAAKTITEDEDTFEVDTFAYAWKKIYLRGDLIPVGTPGRDRSMQDNRSLSHPFGSLLR